VIDFWLLRGNYIIRLLLSDSIELIDLRRKAVKESNPPQPFDGGELTEKIRNPMFEADIVAVFCCFLGNQDDFFDSFSARKRASFE
jgi:hypothetical protein